MFESLGMHPSTARDAASQVHANTEQALRVHLAHELGLSPDEKQSPRVAAIASLVSFSVGAIIPVLPFLIGFGTLGWGLLFGGVGLLAAGFAAAKFTDRNPFASAGRQLLFGGIAVAATYGIGTLLGVSQLG